MIKTKDGFKLSTGKEFYAYRHTLGLSVVDNELTFGFDGDGFNGSAELKEMNFTPAECREIADYMINVWNQWAVGEK